MRILIADRLAPLVQGRLQDLGGEVRVDAALGAEALTQALGQLDPHVLVVRSTRVRHEDIAAADALSLVIRAGAGVNTIDISAASSRGVYVANCPGKNAHAVAELTLGHLINLDRRLADNVHALRAGMWNKKAFSKAPGLYGRRLAVLGCGPIGREVIRRARAMGMEVVAWSRSLSESQAEALGVLPAPTPEEAVKDADAVSVHLALTPETQGRIGAGLFNAMKPGSYFINTARGELVDYAALRTAIEGKGIKVGLDVFEREPSSGEAAFEDSLVQLDGVYGTHHIGASTVQASEAVGEEVVRIVAAYREGAPIPNCVNLAVRTSATHTLVVRHEDKVGVLAGVLDVLRREGHNVKEMQNIVFSGAPAACARVAVVGEPQPRTVDALRAHPSVFDVSVTGGAVNAR